jgi:hypothetical protein
LWRTAATAARFATFSTTLAVQQECRLSRVRLSDGRFFVCSRCFLQTCQSCFFYIGATVCLQPQGRSLLSLCVPSSCSQRGARQLWRGASASKTHCLFFNITVRRACWARWWARWEQCKPWRSSRCLCCFVCCVFLNGLFCFEVLVGCGESLSGRLLVFDGLRAKQRVVQLRGKRADCAACGQNKQTKQQYDNEEEEEEGGCAVAVDSGALERGARECAVLLKVSKQARGREERGLFSCCLFVAGGGSSGGCSSFFALFVLSRRGQRERAARVSGRGQMRAAAREKRGQGHRVCVQKR